MSQKNIYMRDDFREYTIPVEAEGIDYIAVTLSNGMGVLDISII